MLEVGGRTEDIVDRAVGVVSNEFRNTERNYGKS